MSVRYVYIFNFTYYLQEESETGQEKLYPHFNLKNTKILDDHVEAYFAFETNDWAQDEFDLSYKFDYRLKYYKEGSSFVIDRTDVVSLI